MLLARCCKSQYIAIEGPDKEPAVEAVTPAPIDLAMALCREAFSIDEVLSWGLARPSALWGALRQAIADGLLTEGAADGQFTWASSERRRHVILSASAEAWRAVLGSRAMTAHVVDRARAAAAQSAFDVAEALYRAAILNIPPDACPGGAAAWVALVIDSIRLFRNVEWRTPEVLDRAIDAAIAHGDLRAQALLLATRAYEVLRDGRDADSAADVEHARDAAAAVGDAALSREVHLLAAIGFVYQGKFLEAISLFERYLGDVPDDEGDAAPEPIAESLFGPVAIAYAVTGQTPRALDIAHRILDRGVALQQPALIHLADVTLAHVHLLLRDPEGVRPAAERAYAFWETQPAQPLYLWLSCIALAWVRMVEHRPTDAAALLCTGHRARIAAGSMTYWGSALFEVLLWLEGHGIVIDGMRIEDEAERLLARPNPHLQAIAHRLLAARALDHHTLATDHPDHDGPATERPEPSAEAEEIDFRLTRAEALLRQVGASAELIHVLLDKARWYDHCGRAGDAGPLRSEVGELRARFTHDAVPVQRDERFVAHFNHTLIDMGRLALLRTGEGMWGELAAQLCRTLRVERCVIAEDGEPPQILAIRGGNERWRVAVRDRLLRPPALATGFTTPTGGNGDEEAAAVRFAAPGSRRRGVILLENKYSVGFLAAHDEPLLDLVGEQLGVIVDNLLLRQELLDVRQRLEQETRYYREQGESVPGTGAIVGDTPAIRHVYDQVARVAATSTPVLLLGETGVGKELFAREIHDRGPRREGPFVAVHIASLSPGLVASALFGHERGAFTGAVSQVQGRFELAHRGTLFLDEIGELGPEEQVRLLRVLQEGTFERVGGNRPVRSDFRLVAATNRDLDAEVRSGHFRQDLFYRLNVFPIRVPPLRERPADIPALALYFMERSARRLGRPFDGIGEADMERLLAYPWPGNVRELMHVIERAAVLSDGPRLRIPALGAAEHADGSPPPRRRDEDLVTLAEAERRHIRRVLAHTRGRVTGDGGAAQVLGLKPSTLNFRIRKLGLHDELSRMRRGQVSRHGAKAL
jgi:transcriptional regulator with GAF, ATPase, and Fis domain